jgi:hypothetical protein
LPRNHHASRYVEKVVWRILLEVKSKPRLWQPDIVVIHALADTTTTAVPESIHANVYYRLVTVAGSESVDPPLR